MSCAKHGWPSKADCVDCLNEKRKERDREERFVHQAAIFFYEKRWYHGASDEALERLRLDCWNDARALYRSGYQIKQPFPSPVMPEES